MHIIDIKRISEALREAKDKQRMNEGNPLSEASIEARACIECFSFVLECCKKNSDNADLEYTAHVLLNTQEEKQIKLDIPIDAARCENVSVLAKMLEVNSPENFKFWVTAALPVTKENIEIERQQEKTLKEIAGDDDISARIRD